MDKLHNILPLLRQFGISPDQLGPERLEQLMKISDQISDPSAINSELASKVMDTLGITTARNSQTKKPVKKKKIGRNTKCPCESGLKWKKCCMPLNK
jgi:uncharacterized protein YecA (UPF0149 family)